MKILTDYLITDEQSPLWKEKTDYLFDFPSPIRELSQIKHLKFIKKIFERVDQSHVINALRLFRLRKKYDIVVTGIFQVSEFFGFFQYLFSKNRVSHLIIDFMLDEEKKSHLWRLKIFCQKKAFGEANKILVFSREERKTYSKRFSLPIERFLFLPYHTNVINPEYIGGKDNVIFSAGRSGRDYKTLIEAVKELPCRVKVICDEENLEGIKIPGNCEVHYNTEHKKYLEMMQDAAIVVIPLGQFVRSMGLMVMLEAMAYGKAVVISDGVSNIEYVRNNKNALFCKHKDPNDMKSRILFLLKNKKIREEIGKEALKDVNNLWTFDVFVKNMLFVIEGIVEKQKQ